MGKRILFLHTRELCYYSGSYFLQQMQQAASRLGVDSTYMELSEDGAELEDLLGERYDAVVDLNSKLPYYILDDDTRFLDALGAPFYNYIVDHPIYHHPGLSFPLHDYHAIGIDADHCAYMKNHYEHLKDVTFLPMGVTRSALADVPLAKRPIANLFLGTYESEEKQKVLFGATCRKIATKLDVPGGDMEKRLLTLGGHLRELLAAGRVGADGKREELPYEEALQQLLSPGDLEEGRYGATQFIELANFMYHADKIVRNERRRRMLELATETGEMLTICGEGWEMLDLLERSNVVFLEAREIKKTYDLMAQAQMVLDVNPLFAAGVHDRVSAALINGCVCCSDMGMQSREGFLAEAGVRTTGVDGAAVASHVISYTNWDPAPLADAMLLPLAEREARVAPGVAYAKEELSWDAHAKRLLDCME